MKICYILSPKTNGWFFAPWTLTHDNGKDSFFLSKLYIFKNEWVKETQFDSMNISSVKHWFVSNSLRLRIICLPRKKHADEFQQRSWVSFVSSFIESIFTCVFGDKKHVAVDLRLQNDEGFIFCYVFYPCFLVWMTVEYDILILNKAPFELYSCLSILISRDIIHANRTTERRTQFGSVILPVFLHVFFSLFIFIYIQI